jgi:hypothetical protein
MLQKGTSNSFSPIILLFFRFLLNYIAYSILTFAIIVCFAWFLIFDVITFHGTISSSFLGMFSIFNPLYGSDSFSLGNKEALQIFFYTTIIVFVASLLFKLIYRIIKKEPLVLSIRQKVLYSIFLVTFFHLTAFISMFFGKYINASNWIVVMVFLIVSYVISTLAVLSYVVLRNFAKLLVKDEDL